MTLKSLQQYFRATSPDEAVDIKKSFGERALYLAGATDILVNRPTDVEALIDVRYAGLAEVSQTDDGLVIGAAVRLRDIEDPVAGVAGGMLRVAIRETAPWLIRNAATLAGNIANASPAADSLPALLALDAELELLDGRRGRVKVSDVLVGPHRTTLGDNLILGIRIPSASMGRRGFFVKHARSKSDIAQVNLAVTMRLEGSLCRDVRIALGAVAPTAIRAAHAESLLEGAEVTPDLLKQVELAVREEVRPITDWRATEDYRRRMSGVLARRAVEGLVRGDSRGE